MTSCFSKDRIRRITHVEEQECGSESVSRRTNGCRRRAMGGLGCWWVETVNKRARWGAKEKRGKHEGRPQRRRTWCAILQQSGGWSLAVSQRVSAACLTATPSPFHSTRAHRKVCQTFTNVGMTSSALITCWVLKDGYEKELKTRRGWGVINNWICLQKGMYPSCHQGFQLDHLSLCCRLQLSLASRCKILP